MRKIVYAVFSLALIVVSFVAGSWYSQREAVKINPIGVKSPTTDPEKIPDTVIGTDTNIGTSSLPSAVKIGPEKQQVIGIRVAAVEKRPMTHSLRILGRVAVDERKVYIINTAAGGWVREISPVTVGSLVQKGQKLATFYSPEFLAAQQAYFYALNALDRFTKGATPNPDQIKLTKANVRQYGDSLRSLGMGERQIEEIGRTRTFTDQIEMASPTGGIIVSRNIYLGQRFERATEFFKIADLSQVWILADVYENEVKYLRRGAKALLRSPNYNMTFQAAVSDVPPIFDPASRTLKVRFETENQGEILRPDMFVDVELPITLAPAITVPADAILDSGLKKTVFVDRGNGYFEPREVETGWRMGNRIEIVKGLEPGERIVISGNFLVDSESKLEMAAQGMYTTLSKDPVCGIDVAMRKAEKAGLKTSHGGKNYYFHSDECKQKFDKEPDRYVNK